MTTERLLRRTVRMMVNEGRGRTVDWDQLVDRIVDSCWEGGFHCDPAHDRFDMGTGNAVSGEVRFDSDSSFNPAGIEQRLITALESLGLDAHVTSAPSHFGTRRILAPAGSYEVIIDLDNLIDTTDPYVALYLRPKKGSIREAKRDKNDPHSHSISYTCIKLDDSSKRDLQRLFQTKYPDMTDWKVHCDHVTIAMDALPADLGDLDVKHKFDMMVTDTSQLPTAAVARVHFVSAEDQQALQHVQDQMDTPTPFFHVTLATSSKGSPKDSKKISDWHELEEPIKVRGSIVEVPFK